MGDFKSVSELISYLSTVIKPNCKRGVTSNNNIEQIGAKRQKLEQLQKSTSAIKRVTIRTH